MEYREADFQGMTFNVYPVPMDADLFATFPVLESYEEFITICPLPKKHVFRYIFYAYDKGSPIVINHQTNILKRKYEAASLAGFRISSTKKFEDLVERMIQCEHSSVNNMIIRFLWMQGDHDFSYLSALVDGLYRELPNIQRGDIKNIDKVDKMKRTIEDLQKKITSNDDSRKLNVDIYKFMNEEKRIGLRPEDIMAKIKKGEPATVAQWQ